MKNTENGCILLKQKEYDDLLVKSKENSSKEIKVSWSYSNLQIHGDFNLSDGLYNQIRRILLKIDLKHIEEKSNILRQQKSVTQINMCNAFKNLPWYKRLFFKFEYIND